MAKTITLRISDDTYKVLSNHAEAEKRSISNFIEVAAMQYAMVSEFVDMEEMNDILSDAGLIKRMQQGIKSAKARRGKFVA